MELMRNQDQEKDINSELPSKLIISPSSGVRDRRDQTNNLNSPQTPDHHHPYHQTQHHVFNPQHQQHRPKRDHDSNFDPSQPLSPAPIATASPGTTIPITSIPAATKLPEPQSRPLMVVPSPAVQYRECMKNHAAAKGGHVVDGCGEFMPSGEEGSLEFLKCAACGCHRNFHRKEIDGENQNYGNTHYNCSSKINSQRALVSPTQHHQIIHHANPINLHHQRFTYGPTHSPSGPPPQPMMMAFGSGAAESSSEDLNMFQSDDAAMPSVQKKRSRTKFTQEQKDKMMEFAEKLGWKIQKQDEHEMLQFCAEVGVKRQVFKVWMHNNKQAMKKKQM